MMKKIGGWKNIPMTLKVIFVLLSLWIVGSLFAISGRFELGLPFFGVWISGVSAALIVIVLDILAPGLFLYAIWNKKSWGLVLANSYMGIFILNSIVAFFTVRGKIGAGPVIVPAFVTLLILMGIYKEKDYF